MSLPLNLRVAARYLEERMARNFGVIPRELMLPPDLRKKPSIKPEGTDLEIWTWFDQKAAQGQGRFFGIAYQAKSNKPLWHWSFKTRDALWKQINQSIESRKLSLKYKQEQRDKRLNAVPDVKVGDIFYRSWGYDQTNINFYEVTAVKGKSAILREVGKRVVKEDSSAEYVVAAPGKFKGAPMKKLVQGDGRDLRVKMEHGSASLWDGKPKYQTGPYAGH